MALFNSLLLSDPLHRITGGGHLPVIRRPLFQVARPKEKNLHASRTLDVSRRDTLLYLTAETVTGFTLFSTEKTAEARVGRLEKKKRAMEKLEKLREKAGVSSTSKTENNTSAPQAQPVPKGSTSS